MGLGIRVQSVRVRVEVLRCRVSGLSSVEGRWFRVSGLGFRD